MGWCPTPGQIHGRQQHPEHVCGLGMLHAAQEVFPLPAHHTTILVQHPSSTLLVQSPPPLCPTTSSMASPTSLPYENAGPQSHSQGKRPQEVPANPTQGSHQIQVVPGLTQLGLENFQAWRPQNLSRQSTSHPDYPHGKKGVLIASLDLFPLCPLCLVLLLYSTVVSLAPC